MLLLFRIHGFGSDVSRHHRWQSNTRYVRFDLARCELHRGLFVRKSPSNFFLLSFGIRFLFTSTLLPVERNWSKTMCECKGSIQSWNFRSGRFRQVTWLRWLMFGCDKFIPLTHFIHSIITYSMLHQIFFCLIYSEIWN